MKIPNFLDVKQATTLAISALAAAIFIAVFGPVVAYALAAIAFIAGAYAAVAKWAPEMIAPKSTK